MVDTICCVTQETGFNNSRGDYHTKRHGSEPFIPKGASGGWPGWRCKGGCGRIFPEDTDKTRCPECHAPLVRWIQYEEKK